MTITGAINWMIRLTGLCTTCWLLGYFWQENMIEQSLPEVTYVVSPSGKSVASYHVKIIRKLLSDSCEREIWINTNGRFMTFKPERLYVEICNPHAPYYEPTRVVWVDDKNVEISFFANAGLMTGKHFVIFSWWTPGRVRVHYRLRDY